MLEQFKAEVAMQRLREELAGTYVGRDALEPILKDYVELRGKASELKAGDRVEHGIWGRGTIIGACAQTGYASVHFDRDGDEDIRTTVPISSLTNESGED